MTRFAKLALAALIAVATLPAFNLPAFAADVTAGNLTLSGAWTRATPPRARAGGGFLTIANSGEADRLVSVSSPVSTRTEIHEMAVQDGVMKMREMADGVEVPAGGTLELRPGGYHVMFLELTGPLKEGESVPVTLTFEKAGTVEMSLSVEKMGAKGMSGHGMGHDMGQGMSGHGQHGAKE